MAVRAYAASTTEHLVWTSKTGYGLLDFVAPTIPNGYCYECTVPGVSGSSEPSWTTTLGENVIDGDEGQENPVTWTCRTLLSPNPLKATLDTGGYGGYPYKEVWVRSARTEGRDEFIVYGSHDGYNWRQIDEVGAPHANRDNRHKGLVNAYRHIRVVVDSKHVCEIEIVAGG